uniref:CBM21 domain-containing protein n=1 Tax=Amphiprion percula TaxID=161767 RepID=A0A3P8TTT1_AMPPE
MAAESDWSMGVLGRRSFPAVFSAFSFASVDPCASEDCGLSVLLASWPSAMELLTGYDDTDVRLIPRCSPVPRKRGASIYDETAEYMRIHLALSAGKRVSFADTTGGDLVDMREFVAFDTDEEEGSARWEEEEFNAAAGENEPLAFRVLIRVLNVSFHKSVYIRTTMDNWATYFDHPAEYVQGSNDGDTDQFSLKLSFAPPYLTHGSRIEFVVRYETSDGDYWANNSSMNYVITLLLSYEEDPALANADVKQIRSILKPPKAYRYISCRTHTALNPPAHTTTLTLVISTVRLSSRLGTYMWLNV